MHGARLTAGIWVAAYLARLRQAGIPAYVIARGDETAGAVLIRVSTLDGQGALWQRGPGGLDGERGAWVELACGADAELDDVVARQRRFDRDLWVIEIEDKAGRNLLDEPGLAS